ncbi:hypothetical protein PRIPAC_90723, partial [Pristionchus pacificus]|uniref:Uncharacterized protein n=1 Tax=Pristionchus pacificus TaxID=54126 RepID=A0A2A6CYF7_PRIPA
GRSRLVEAARAAAEHARAHYEEGEVHDLKWIKDQTAEIKYQTGRSASMNASAVKQAAQPRKASELKNRYLTSSDTNLIRSEAAPEYVHDTGRYGSHDIPQTSLTRNWTSGGMAAAVPIALVDILSTRNMSSTVAKFPTAPSQIAQIAGVAKMARCGNGDSRGAGQQTQAGEDGSVMGHYYVAMIYYPGREHLSKL